MNINLHIDRLVLDGIPFDSHQRPMLQQALQVELTRLLANGSLHPNFAGGIALHKLTLPGIQLAENPKPTQLGQQIADALYGGIGHE